eukprot:364562-Chlamydomonas_euryale.AAC.6
MWKIRFFSGIDYASLGHACGPSEKTLPGRGVGSGRLQAWGRAGGSDRHAQVRLSSFMPAATAPPFLLPTFVFWGAGRAFRACGVAPVRQRRDGRARRDSKLSRARAASQHCGVSSLASSGMMALWRGSSAKVSHGASPRRCCAANSSRRRRRRRRRRRWQRIPTDKATNAPDCITPE